MPSSQQSAWNREYEDPRFLSLGTEPQQDLLRFIKFLKVDHQDLLVEGKFVVDMGCGIGRNLNYLVQNFGIKGVGYDFSEKAIELARQQAVDLGMANRTQYVTQSIAMPLTELEDDSVSIVLDITSSNALYEGERTLYLKEVSRILQSGGIFFTRTLCKDGDRNARRLLELSPGPEKDTYLLPEIGIVERVFSESDFRELYGRHFNILFFKKQTGYQRWGSQSYKRRYIVAYMNKKR